MTDFEYNPKDGLTCPWCPEKPRIKDCQHNPFKLMDKVRELEEIIYKDKEFRKNYNDFVNVMKRILQV